MTIPVHYYFQASGISGIVRISSQWSEESGGYENEHIDETIAGKENDKFYLIDAHLKIKTMGGEEFDIINKKISKDTYASYCERHGGGLDTPEYRKTFNQITKTF